MGTKPATSEIAVCTNGRADNPTARQQLLPPAQPPPLRQWPYHLTTVAANPRLLRLAKLAFLNSPHPLQILADRSAYGSSGTIQRDHDMSSYLRCVRSVIRRDLAQLRQHRREKRRDTWRSLIVPRVGVVGESVKRLSRHVHLLVLLLFPARWLLVGAYSVLDGFLFQ